MNAPGEALERRGRQRDPSTGRFLPAEQAAAVQTATPAVVEGEVLDSTVLLDAHSLAAERLEAYSIRPGCSAVHVISGFEFDPYLEPLGAGLICEFLHQAGGQR